jgi:hypothetical protein
MLDPQDVRVVQHINESVEKYGVHRRTSCPPNSCAMCRYHSRILTMMDAGKIPDKDWITEPLDAG